MKAKTISDLNELDRIQNAVTALLEEKEHILNHCACLDFKLAIKETFAFEFTTVKCCMVCDKTTIGTLNLNERIEILTEEFKGLYTKEQILKFAKAGGFNS